MEELLKKRAAALKKAEVVDKTKRAPTAVEGVNVWFNLPPSWNAVEHNLLAQIQKEGNVKCILVDFFAYSCTNCLRTIPVLKRLHHTYHDKGLRIVAFHRPEFSFEKVSFIIRLHQGINMISCRIPSTCGSLYSETKSLTQLG